jgi:hypothetical protein
MQPIKRANGSTPEKISNCLPATQAPLLAEMRRVIVSKIARVTKAAEKLQKAKSSGQRSKHSKWLVQRTTTNRARPAPAPTAPDVLCPSEPPCVPGSPPTPTQKCPAAQRSNSRTPCGLYQRSSRCPHCITRPPSDLWSSVLGGLTSPRHQNNPPTETNPCYFWSDG